MFEVASRIFFERRFFFAAPLMLDNFRCNWHFAVPQKVSHSLSSRDTEKVIRQRKCTTFGYTLKRHFVADFCLSGRILPAGKIFASERFWYDRMIVVRFVKIKRFLKDSRHIIYQMKFFRSMTFGPNRYCRSEIRVRLVLT